MFRKILIANRGEIAVRIAQTVQEMGIRAAAVYSGPDRGAPHVAAADEAYPLEGKTAAETYLRGEKIVEMAKRIGADAIHPGYGFLSEHASFAELCKAAGVVFIGPSPQVIRATGNKIDAKKTLGAAGVPIVPGWMGSPGEAPKDFLPPAAKIGYPVLVKAAGGGGGKGMRVVRHERDLVAGVESARREAAAAFGDGHVFLEKYMERPRHVEFQIFGDSHGNVVHLFERECSIQRRHQKILEETPSPALSPELREQMGEAAVRAGRAVGYTNAGTVEFLVDEMGGFYFLEINTRLQVEHPVTELTTGQDLVRAQILVAAGERLPFAQEQLRQKGHAMEARIYAEDADRGFLPSTGTVEVYVPPAGPGIRVDSGVTQGSEVSVFYDPLLAKLIVHGGNREESLRKLDWALNHFVVLGVTTNIAFLKALIADADVQAGRLHTQFLDERPLNRSKAKVVPAEVFLAAALASRAAGGQRSAPQEPSAAASLDGPWTAGAWRGA